MSEGLDFMRSTRGYPQIRAAVQADGWQASLHRWRMITSMVIVTRAVLDFQEATRRWARAGGLASTPTDPQPQGRQAADLPSQAHSEWQEPELENGWQNAEPVRRPQPLDEFKLPDGYSARE